MKKLKFLIYLNMLAVHLVCSCQQESPKRVLGLFKQKELPLWISQPEKFQKGGVARYQLDRDGLVSYFIAAYQNYREAKALPSTWTDSKFCDQVYFFTSSERQVIPEYSSIHRLERSYLNRYFQKNDFQDLEELWKIRKNLQEYLSKYELAILRPVILDSFNLNRLEEKYSKPAEDCLDYQKLIEGNLEIPLCFWFMNRKILDLIRVKIKDPNRIFFWAEESKHETDSTYCLPFDIFIEYSFKKGKNGCISFERRVLNPYVFMESVVF